MDGSERIDVTQPGGCLNLVNLLPSNRSTETWSTRPESTGGVKTRRRSSIALRMSGRERSKRHVRAAPVEKTGRRDGMSWKLGGEALLLDRHYSRSNRCGALLNRILETPHIHESHPAFARGLHPDKSLVGEGPRLHLTGHPDNRSWFEIHVTPPLEAPETVSTLLPAPPKRKGALRRPVISVLQPFPLHYLSGKPSPSECRDLASVWNRASGRPGEPGGGKPTWCQRGFRHYFEFVQEFGESELAEHGSMTQVRCFSLGYGPSVRWHSQCCTRWVSVSTEGEDS